MALPEVSGGARCGKILFEVELPEHLHSFRGDGFLTRCLGGGLACCPHGGKKSAGGETGKRGASKGKGLCFARHVHVGGGGR